MNSKNHELSARTLPIRTLSTADSDLTVAVYDDDGIRLFAEGPGGFHIARELDHLKAAESALVRALETLRHFKAVYKESTTT